MPRMRRQLSLCGAILSATFALSCSSHRTAASAPPSDPAATPPASSQSSDLVALGESRFKTNKCDECHGPRGEGTDDAPDLIHSHLTAEEVAAFLQKPSAHARVVGMPVTPADSPDLQPLVAFVLSLKRPL